MLAPAINFKMLMHFLRGGAPLGEHRCAMLRRPATTPAFSGGAARLGVALGSCADVLRVVAQRPRYVRRVRELVAGAASNRRTAESAAERAAQLRAAQLDLRTRRRVPARASMRPRRRSRRVARQPSRNLCSARVSRLRRFAWRRLDLAPHGGASSARRAAASSAASSPSSNGEKCSALGIARGDEASDAARAPASRGTRRAARRVQRSASLPGSRPARVRARCSEAARAAPPPPPRRQPVAAPARVHARTPMTEPSSIGVDRGLVSTRTRRVADGGSRAIASACSRRTRREAASPRCASATVAAALIADVARRQAAAPSVRVAVPSSRPGLRHRRRGVAVRLVDIAPHGGVRASRGGCSGGRAAAFPRSRAT